MAVLAVAYITAVYGARLVITQDAPPSALSVAVSLVPGAVILGVIWAMGRLLTELDDEYLRLLEVRKFIVATGLTLALSSVWGLLELFTTIPRVPVFYVMPVWCLGLLAGTLYNRITMGDGGGGCP